MTGLKWTRKTTEKIADELSKLGINVGANTVSRLLRQLKFSLRVNHKKLSSGSKADKAERNEQFEYISDRKEEYKGSNNPIVSVDTKKKEMIGNFKNSGTAWSKEPVLVKDHDFISEADGKAVPYSIYDVQANKGTVYVGKSADTAEFAVDSIVKWWSSEGKHTYPNAEKILILADGGGSNGYRNRAWKANLQKHLCDPFEIDVTVCHYPKGASKWNPVEHRLHSEISKNWAARPLNSIETILKYIRTTKTTTGLTVKAHLSKKNYKTGVKISDEAMEALALQAHDVQPQRNYTLHHR